MGGRLDGRVALVTGASSGLGRHFAEVMAAQGARVVVAARRADRLTALVEQVESRGGEALGVACDVTDEASVIAAFDAAEARFGVVDTVVCNAGMTTSDPALVQSAAEFRQVMDLNVTAVFLTAREAAQRLVKAGPDVALRGRIINIASIGARHVLPGVAAYSTSKAAVAMLTRALAREWAKYGINVNSLSPGYVATELNTDWLNSESGQKMLARTSRRRIMPPESLDEALLYLASDGAAYVTGTDVVVDDGQAI